MKLGCIGDDFTGSSDLANTLAQGGMETRQYVGIPSEPAGDDVAAGVVSLKTRSLPVEEAVAQSLAALKWLQAQGCEQIFFKYCSTFDSTPEGNIGPVIDALADVLRADEVIVCPAFPGTGRSIYQGHLFAKDRLLNESGMQNHPLTPMVDADIRRWLAPQTRHQVGHVAAEIVFAGAAAIKAALAQEAKEGRPVIVVDAIRDAELMEIGAAAKDLPLVTGGSGVALGLPLNFGCTAGTSNWCAQAGPVVALSGSCSLATREQVAGHLQNHSGRKVGAEDIMEGRVHADEIATWALDQGSNPLIYSSSDPAEVQAAQQTYGQIKIATVVEAFFADLARALVARGVTRLISAGGETSGAVVSALQLSTLEIGPEIDPGVPALRAGQDLVVALKSGNFGAVDFFAKAARVLGHERENHD